MALRIHPSLYTHVGEWLKTEIVTLAGVSVTALAKHLGISRQTLSDLLNGNTRLSADIAIRFEKAFGIKADTLLRMQAVALSGVNHSAFMMKAEYTAAVETIPAHEHTMLEPMDHHVIFAALDRPAAPAGKLHAAFARNRETIESK